MAFCAFCGTELDQGAVICPSPKCRSRRAPAPAAPSGLDLDEVRWLLSRCQGRPWRIGDNHWEVLDAAGNIVLRVETPNARELARFLAAAPRIVEGLLPPG